MYIIAGSTGTLGTAIVKELSNDNELLLIGRDEDKLKEQASLVNASYQVIDLKNTVEPREFAKIVDTETEIKGLINCIGSILIKPLHGTSIEEFNDVITTNLFSSYFLLASFASFSFSCFAERTCQPIQITKATRTKILSVPTPG